MTDQRYKKRVFVSFDGQCPMNCRHCYTYGLDMNHARRSAEEIVGAVKEKETDIIYVSHNYENFYKQKDGLALCELLYAACHKDIFVITRSYLSDETLHQLGSLNLLMNRDGHQLYIAVSLCADNSYAVTEDPSNCPEPGKRLSNLARAHEQGIKTILLLRPIFPNSVVPVTECMNLVIRSKDYVSAVVSSGLIVTDMIIGRLAIEEKYLVYTAGGASEYLDELNDPSVRYVDVTREIEQIEKTCMSSGIPFFSHSIPALNYLRSQVDIKVCL